MQEAHHAGGSSGGKLYHMGGLQDASSEGVGVVLTPSKLGPQGLLNGIVGIALLRQEPL